MLKYINTLFFSMGTKHYSNKFSKDKLTDDLYWNISGAAIFCTAGAVMVPYRKVIPASGQDEPFYFTKTNWKGGLYLPSIISAFYETTLLPFYYISRIIRETIIY